MNQKKQILFLCQEDHIQRLQKRLQGFGKKIAPYVLPSGRYSKLLGSFSGVSSKNHIYNKEYETEWEFLKDVLIKNGVKEEAILKEDKATFTYENALYSK